MMMEAIYDGTFRPDETDASEEAEQGGSLLARGAQISP